MSLPPATIPEMLRATVANGGDQYALGSIRNGQLTWRTWSELNADVEKFTAALASGGIHSGDRVAQLSENRYEWIITDLAILSLGAVHVPLHIALSTEQIVGQLTDSGAKLLVVAKAEQKSAIQKHVLLLQVASHEDLRTIRPCPLHPAPCTLPDSLATILYTSGTTGRPRGVMLSHRNLIANAVATNEAVGGDHVETRLCFLPLTHVYARTCDLYSWLYRGTRLVLAESRETIVRDCELVRPTVINGVPYFYQKVAQQLRAAAAEGRQVSLPNMLGGNVKRCFCGGAAVAPEVEALFAEQGLPLLSGYGLTEASPVVSATSLENYCRGTVGQPLANLEVQLASDGEILVRGPSVMQGYWQNQQATDAVIIDGWLHTGDLGEMDEERNLRIIGRKKEILVLSTGKKVSPIRVEQLLASSPLVEHVCVVGEGRACLAALIVPNPDALRAEIRQRRLWVWSKRRAVSHPAIRALFRAEIDRLLASAGRNEQVGPFAILPRTFSVAGGELTPKLSLRRRQIGANFAPLIERLYASIAVRR